MIFSNHEFEDMVATVLVAVFIGLGIYWLFNKLIPPADIRPPVDCNAICYPNVYVGYSLDKKACICDATRIMKEAK